MKKELKCKKCGKILAIQEGTRVSVKGKVEMEFDGNRCIFTCLRCKQKNVFGILPLT